MNRSETNLDLDVFNDSGFRPVLDEALRAIRNNQWTKSLVKLRIVYHNLDLSQARDSKILILNQLLSRVLYLKGIRQFNKIPRDDGQLPFRAEVERRVTARQGTFHKYFRCASCSCRLAIRRSKIEICGKPVVLCVNCKARLLLEKEECVAESASAIANASDYFETALYFGSIKASEKLQLLKSKAERLNIELPDQQLAKLHLNFSSISELITLSQDADPTVQLAAIRALAGKRSNNNTVIPALVSCQLDSNPSARLAAIDALDEIDIDWLSGPQINLLRPMIESAYLHGNKGVRNQAEFLLQKLEPEFTSRLKWKKYRRRCVLIGSSFLVLAGILLLFQIGLFLANNPAAVKLAYSVGWIDPGSAVTRITHSLNSPDTETSETAARILEEMTVNQKTAEVPSAALNRITTALGSKSAEVRNFAAKTLAQFGGSAKGSLAKLVEVMISDSDALVRDSAGRAIGAIDASGVTVTDLIRALTHKECHVRKAAAITLGHLGTTGRPAIPALIQALRPHDCSYRGSTRELIGAAASQLASEKTLSTMTSQTQSPSSKIQEAALIAFGKMGAYANTAVPALVAAAGFNDFRLRKTAFKTLGRLGNTAREAIPYLFIYLEDPDVEIRQATKICLNKIDSNWAQPNAYWRSMDSLADVYDHFSNGLHLPDPSMQLLYANALTHMGQTGMPVILDSLESGDDFIRHTVLAALPKLVEQVPDAIPSSTLIKLLGDQDRDIRSKTIELIAKMGSHASDTVPQLAQLLTREKYSDLKERIVVALGKIGANAAPAVPRIKALIHDPDWNNQPVVINALNQILSPR